METCVCALSGCVVFAEVKSFVCVCERGVGLHFRESIIRYI